MATNAIAKTGLATLQDLLIRHKGQIEMALPKHMTADRMIRVALTACTTTPKLMECDVKTVAACIIQSAILGLEPNSALGEAYLIPYGKTCQLIPGYQGLLKLVRNSGELIMVNAQVVRANDDFDFEDGLDPYLRHKRATGDRGPVVAYWAGAVLRGGGKQFVVMTKQEVEEHGKKYSKSFTSGPWKTEFDQMGLKTCLRRLCKLLPKSIEAQVAINLEERHEAGLQQRFSIEVPLELQPPAEDQPQIEAGSDEMPKRKSEQQPEQPELVQTS
jgi:recombination protein RecT